MISKDDIKKLATLARIEVSEDELSSMAGDIDGILAYVGEIKNALSKEDITAEYPTKNVLREDVLGAQKTDPETLIKSAPESDGRYIKVKKILS